MGRGEEMREEGEGRKERVRKWEREGRREKGKEWG